ncbi:MULTISPECIES: helix-turn-helix domain-containing protein [Azotobacter]|nr:hypothetical protein [Azotobacter vinelandii]GLK62319.1 hypothetical protein GCM10017624_44830 [Azotobacter vinelandii]SFX44155.1 hypothetical protein SAMN04244547_01587 [Azotobacter vinelandii]
MATSSYSPASESSPLDQRHYGQRIAEERERLGFTQAEFATLLGIGIKKGRAIEQGSQRPLTTQLMPYLALQRVDMNYVLIGKRIQRD